MDGLKYMIVIFYVKMRKLTCSTAVTDNKLFLVLFFEKICSQYIFHNLGFIGAAMLWFQA
jgi:hypothetical protein